MILTLAIIAEGASRTSYVQPGKKKHRSYRLEKHPLVSPNVWSVYHNNNYPMQETRLLDQT